MAIRTPQAALGQRPIVCVVIQPSICCTISAEAIQLALQGSGIVLY